MIYLIHFQKEAIYFHKHKISDATLTFGALIIALLDYIDKHKK